MCYEQKKNRRNPNRKCNLRSLAPHAAAECNFKSKEEEEWENSRYRPLPPPQLFQWELHGHRAAAGSDERRSSIAVCRNKSLRQAVTVALLLRFHSQIRENSHFYWVPVLSMIFTSVGPVSVAKSWRQWQRALWRLRRLPNITFFVAYRSKTISQKWDQSTYACPCLVERNVFCIFLSLVLYMKLEGEKNEEQWTRSRLTYAPHFTHVLFIIVRSNRLPSDSV